MWVVPAKPECYLRMFPDRLDPEKNGEVFQLPKAADADIAVNREKWERCQDCHYYRHCFDLGLAEFVLSRLPVADFRRRNNSVAGCPS